MNAPHPAADLLRQYSIGQMSDESAGELEQHLADCPQCEETLDNLAVNDETLISELRRPAVVDPVLEEPELLAALAQIVEHAAGVSESAGESAVEAEGREIGAYRLLEELGSGGMGTVYKALHTRLEKEVALKILATERLRDPQSVSRFDREMKAVGKLDHAHIVRAFDAGEVDGQHFLVTEYVKGCDLSQLSRKLGPLPIADACELARQAALGLEEAHEHGMVHRDIKPANLFLARQKGRPPMVKVLDLGLALIAGEHAPTDELTGTGQIMGTIDYMAPEQAGDTHNVDIRADIYSLGATLFRLLTGSSIFATDKYLTLMQKLSALANQPVPPIQSRRADVPEKLAAVLHRMLEKDPAGRYATPADVAKALEPFCVGQDLAELLRQPASEETIVDAAANSASVHDGSVETQDAVAVDPELQPTIVSGEETVLRARAGRGGLARWVIGGVALALFAAAGLYYSGILFKLKTADGTLVIEVENAEAKGLVVEVNNEKRSITVGEDGKSVTVSVPSGEKQQIVVKTADGTVLKTDVGKEVEIVRGKELKITAWLEPVQRWAGGRPVLSAKEADRVRRQFAAWVFSMGGKLSCVEGDTLPNAQDTQVTVSAPSELPRGEFRFWNFYLSNSDFEDEDARRCQILHGLPEKFQFDLNGNTRLTNKGLSYFAGLNIFRLGIKFTGISDDGLRYCKALPLKGLSAGSTKVDGSGLVHLAEIEGLYTISLSKCLVVNDNLRHLAQLKDLTRLDLASNKGLTDAAIPHLIKAERLTYLALTRTRLSAAGIANLSKALPECRILWDGGVIEPNAPQAKPWQPTESQQQFLDTVAKLTSAEQVEAVRNKLREVNPGFDGNVEQKFDGGAVVELSFVTDKVTEIWPVCGLQQLTSLKCVGSGEDKGKLADLAPLAGLPLMELDCDFNNISDLTPLKGLKLTQLSCSFLPVADLTPLKGMPLELLDVSNTDVSDISPLKEMALDNLSIALTQVADISALRGMPLRHLDCFRSSVTDLAPLAGMTLRMLNCNNTPLADLAPVADFEVSTLFFSATPVTDLLPLKGKRIDKLAFDYVHVADVSVLKTMTLRDVYFQIPLFDTEAAEIVRSLKILTINRQVPVVVLAELETRRTSAIEFAKATSILPVNQQLSRVREKLQELKFGGSVRLGALTTGEAISEATVVVTGDSRADLSPLMAFSKLKKLTVTGDLTWPDLSSLKHVPIEELNCPDAMAFQNSGVLKTIATLKTINGKPAAEYWQELPEKMKPAAK